MVEPTLPVPILEITNSNFGEHVLADASPILVDFWAPWCGPCLAFKPILQRAAQMLDGTVRVAKVNVDTEPDLAEAFGISTIPTTLLLKGDKVLGKYLGLIPAATLVAQVREKIEN